MAHSSKEKVHERLRELSAAVNLNDTDAFQAASIAADLHLSRSMASSYLNALHAEGLLVKVAARPALFFDRATLERVGDMTFTETSFLSVAELASYLTARQRVRYRFQDLIGAEGSLKEPVEQAKAAAGYPPCGLPFLLSGVDEAGKAELRDAISRWCVSEGIARDDRAVRAFDAAASAGAEQEQAVVDVLADTAIDLLWILNCQRLTDGSWRELLHGYEAREAALSRTHRGSGVASVPGTGRGPIAGEAAPAVRPHAPAAGGMRLFFDCAGDVSAVPAAWLSRIPMAAVYPSFGRRAVDEREACVYRAFQVESRRMGCKVLVSTNVVRRLVGAADVAGMGDLRRTVQMTCANAMADRAATDDAAPVRVFGTHVPAGQDPNCPPPP